MKRSLITVVIVSALALTAPLHAQGKGGGKGGGGGDPAAAEIVYVNGASIFTMAPDGSQVTKVFTVPQGYHPRFPQWSPDGTQIAFSAVMPNGCGVHVVNADGTDPRTVALTAYQSPLELSWSPAPAPDGKHKICFMDLDWNGDTSFDLYIVNPDGTGLMKLIGGPLAEAYPTWSPDGQRIAAIRRFRDLVIYDLGLDEEGGVTVTGETVVAVGASTLAFPSWGRSHDWIIFSAAMPDFELVIADLNNPEQLFRVTHAPSTEERWASFSPDDAQIAFHRSGVKGGIYRADYNGANAVRINDKGLDPDWRR